jgi:hypothetical protein
LRPEYVQLYLKSHGWHEDLAVPSTKATVYRYPGEPDAEILLPRNQELADYALRMGDVAEMIAAVEQRSIWEVLIDLSASPSQVADIPEMRS